MMAKEVCLRSILVWMILVSASRALAFPSEICATAAGFSAACAKVGATCGNLFLPMLTKTIGLQYTLAVLAGVSVLGYFIPTKLGAGLTSLKEDI